MELNVMNYVDCIRFCSFHDKLRLAWSRERGTVYPMFPCAFTAINRPFDIINWSLQA